MAKPITAPSATAMIARKSRLRSSPRWSTSDMTESSAGGAADGAGRPGSGAEGRPVTGKAAQPSPFHGYYFKILTAQGAAAPGGARSYIVKGEMSGGFALVAWPAQYDATGIMTFIVNQDGVVREKNLGPGTDAAARKMTAYNPDASWQVTQ